jgi:hypothetical protein
VLPQRWLRPGAFGRSLCPGRDIRDANRVNYALLLLLWLAFASFTTLHVVLGFVIGRRLGKLRGWLSFLAFPLTPYFGFKARVKWRSTLWCLLLLGYCSLLFLATR